MSKGSAQRPTDPKALAENWERTFGPKPRSVQTHGESDPAKLSGAMKDLSDGIDRDLRNGVRPDEPWPGNPS